MKKSEIGVGLAVVAAAVLGVAMAVWFGLGKIHHFFNRVEPRIGIVLSVSVATALFCSLSLAAAAYSVARCLRLTARRTERALVYEAFLATLQTDSGTITVLPAVPRALLLIGSRRVLKEYRSLMQVLAGTNPDKARARQHVNRLLFAMRQDVGESLAGLENEDWVSWLGSSIAANHGETDRTQIRTVIPGFAANVPPIPTMKL